MNRFKIVVPSFNSVDFLPKTLHSIEIQTFKDYDVCIIDDASTLKEQKNIIGDYCSRNKWKAIYHSQNTGALQGLVEALKELDCKDDDVVAVIDGDDWLAHENSLKILNKAYREHDIYLTWGQCETYPPGKTPMKYAQPIPDMIIDQNLYRDIPFVFWHPATFKYILWKHIKDSDLRDVHGSYFRLMKDKATLYPMLEMSGYKKLFIDETLYIYNLSNPLNDYATNSMEEIKRVDSLLQSRPRYSPLDFAK